MHVEAGDLETALRNLPKLGFVGVNITVPHKERALDIADHVTDAGRPYRGGQHADIRP